jgi:carboxypeptidase family protein
MRNGCGLYFRLISIPLLVLRLAATLLAQGAERQNEPPAAVPSQLLGRAVDQSGKAVPNAEAILENVTTTKEYRVRTSADGSFRFAVPPGDYRLSVIASGYKTFVVSKLPLVAGDNATANPIMERGDSAEVQRGSASSVVSRTGTALAGKNMTDLPENQRNFVNLVQLSAGATEGSQNNADANSRPGAQHQSSAISLGGQPETTNNSMVDGIDNNERINSQIAVHPSLEAISEIQVFANAYPANFGNAGGGVLNVMTKSGSDNFHGSLFEYFRNDLLDAYPFQFGAHNPKPELRQNQFGGSLGGPVASDKTHFFLDYEAFRLIQGRAPVELTVPTAYEHAHAGDFSDAGGPVLTQMDPVGLAYFRLYPLPNVPGALNQFVSATSGSNNSHSGDLRMDQRLSNRDQLFSRFSYNRSFVYIPGQFPQVQENGMTIDPGGSLTSFPGNMDDTGVNYVLDYTHSFNREASLNLKAGYTFWSEVDSGLNPNLAINKGFGQPGINLPSTSNGLAPVNVLEASPLGTDGYYRPINQADNTFQFEGELALAHGGHDLRMGGALIRRDWRDIGSGYGLGFWIVRDLPSLLQGEFVQVQRQVDLANLHYQSWEPAGYATDFWRAQRNLTLSLGLRYAIFTPPSEIQNRLSDFDLATGRLVVAGQNGVSRTAGVRTDYTGLAPRIGFTWKAFESTTISGGYGLVSFRPIDTFVYQAPPTSYSFGVCSSETCPGGFNSLSAGLPFSPSVDPTNPSGVLLGMRPFHYHSSYMQQFNFGMEDQFKNNTVRVFYVGALGRHIARSFPDINAPPPNTATDPNPLRPFYITVPNVTSIIYIDSEGASSYNALQASLTHTLRNGLSAQINYTWAHALDNAGRGDAGFGTVPALASTIDYGNSNFDVRHRIAGNIFYQLPFGRSDSGEKAWLTKGWQLNLAGTWSTGFPFTVLNATDVSNTNPGASAADRPDQIAPAGLRNTGVARFFNVSAFVPQVPGTLGSERRNQLYGPDSRRLDVSVFKDFSLGTAKNLQFRMECFNVTNTANFAAPAAILGGANFGRLTQLTAGYTPREIQFALRFQF